MVYLGLAQRRGTTMKRAAPLLHVIGAGPWQLRTIILAKSMGLRVLVTDGYADRPGYAVADLHEVADITDLEATLVAARRHRVDGIICDTTDNGVLAAAHVADLLRLPGIGIDAARNCTDKSRMTAAVMQAGLAVPPMACVRSAEALSESALAMGGPWVVKPVDNQSGRGVTVVKDNHRLQAAFATALSCSRSGKVAVQRQVRGLEVIVDSIVVGGRVVRLGLATKVQYPDNPTISERIIYGAQPLPVPTERIDEVNVAAISALGIRQGLVHAEYMISNGEIMALDIAARGGGALIYPLVLPHVSGVNAMRAAIELALGLPTTAVPVPDARAASIEFLRCGPGRVVAIEGVEIASGMLHVAAVQIGVKVGDHIGRLQDKEDRAGLVVALAQTTNDAEAAARQAAAMIKVTVQSH